jgi:hypothetical protein
MTGNDWVVEIKKTHSQSVDVTTEETPNSALFVRMPNFIRRKYEWDKKAIGAELKGPNPDKMVSDRFRILKKENEKITWKVRKEIEK